MIRIISSSLVLSLCLRRLTALLYVQFSNSKAVDVSAMQVLGMSKLLHILLILYRCHGWS